MPFATRTLTGEGAFLASIPVSLVSEWGAYACWIAIPFVGRASLLVTGRWAARRRAASA